MIKEDFSNYWLTNWEKFAVFRMRMFGSVRYSEKARSLCGYGLAEYTKYEIVDRSRRPASNRICLTIKGMAYLEYLEGKLLKDYLFDVINLCIAVSALILSIVL